MTKGKLDKIVSGGMKAKLILIGICVVLLIVMILVLCLTGGDENAPAAGESGSFVSEASDVQPETVNAENPGSTPETTEVDSEPEGTVNQQESGEAPQVSEAPEETATQSGEETPEEPTPAGADDPADNTSPDATPTAQPDPGPTAVQPEPSPTVVPQEPETETTPGKPTMKFSVEQQDDVMVVTTGYCVVEYPFAFSDIIQVSLQETQTGAALKFTASVREQTAPLYTLWFNTDEGVPYGTVTFEGFISNVSVETHDPEGLTTENMVTFNAAQETINDVLKSLADRNHLEKEA